MLKLNLLKILEHGVSVVKIWSDHFNSVCENAPRLPLEETVIEYLSNNSYKDDYNIMDIGLVYACNAWGIQGANDYLNNIIKNISMQKTKIFVSQHIWSSHLHFGDNRLVFSCHAGNNNHIPIPLYSMHYKNLNQKKEKDFGFLGALGTNPIRKSLKDLFPNKVHAAKYGWNLEKDEDNHKKYIDHLNKNYFSLCPRGTGPGSIRLYESMGCGCIPIIISDDYKKPLDWYLNWDDFSITIMESEIACIPDIINNIPDDEIEKMSETSNNVFQKYFSPERIYSIVEMEIDRNTGKRD